MIVSNFLRDSWTVQKTYSMFCLPKHALYKAKPHKLQCVQRSNCLFQRKIKYFDLSDSKQVFLSQKTVMLFQASHFPTLELLVLVCKTSHTKMIVH